MLLLFEIIFPSFDTLLLGASFNPSADKFLLLPETPLLFVEDCFVLTLEFNTNLLLFEPILLLEVILLLLSFDADDFLLSFDRPLLYFETDLPSFDLPLARCPFVTNFPFFTMG